MGLREGTIQDAKFCTYPFIETLKLGIMILHAGEVLECDSQVIPIVVELVQALHVFKPWIVGQVASPS